MKPKKDLELALFWAVKSNRLARISKLLADRGNPTADYSLATGVPSSRVCIDSHLPSEMVFEFRVSFLPRPGVSRCV